MMHKVDADEELKSLAVGLYVYGDDLDPAMVSEALASPPTRCQRKGDEKVAKTGKTVKAKTGMWELVSSVSSLSLAEHVLDIMSKLGHPDICLSSLDGVDVVHLDVYSPGMCFGEGYRYLDLELSLDEMQKLAALGASVRISIVN